MAEYYIMIPDTAPLGIDSIHFGGPDVDLAHSTPCPTCWKPLCGVSLDRKWARSDTGTHFMGPPWHPNCLFPTMLVHHDDGARGCEVDTDWWGVAVYLGKGSNVHRARVSHGVRDVHAIRLQLRVPRDHPFTEDPFEDCPSCPKVTIDDLRKRLEESKNHVRNRRDDWTPPA